jgi:hypothetical protein
VSSLAWVQIPLSSTNTPLFFWLRTYERLMLLLLLCCSALLSWSLCIAQCQQITLCGSYSMKQLCILNCCLISNCSTATAVCKSSQLTVVPVMMCVRQHMLECVSAVVLLCKLLLASCTVKACTVLACKACSAYRIDKRSCCLDCDVAQIMQPQAVAYD